MPTTITINGTMTGFSDIDGDPISLFQADARIERMELRFAARPMD
jgi:hypothetical protein